MRVRVNTCEGKEEVIEGAREVVPFAGVFVSSLVKKPWDGVVNYRGKLLPVAGPIPHLWSSTGSYDERPWLLVCGDHVRVIQGLPSILESVESRSDLEGEILALEKSALSA